MPIYSKRNKPVTPNTDDILNNFDKGAYVPIRDLIKGENKDDDYKNTRSIPNYSKQLSAQSPERPKTSRIKI